MNNNVFSNDFLEIISGTNNKLHPLYTEASNNVNNNTPKSLSYIKKFITSIENIANKESVKDDRISKSKGNIKNLSLYEDIKVSINFLKKNLGNNVKNLDDIFNALEKFQPQYSEAYEKNVRLVELEYENAVYLLITGLSLTMAENINIVQNGVSIKIEKKSSNNNGIIKKTISDFAKQLNSKNHKEYLDELIKSKEYLKINTNIEESVSFMEATVSNTIELVDLIFTGVGKIGHYTMNIVKSVKSSLFGIIPLIRSCLYLRYKKKADTIIALEQQVEFINQNIERLENRTNINEKEKAAIIKRQKAVIESYNKKAAKLRAQLIDTEREAANNIESDNKDIKSSKNNNDDDFVLESVGWKSSNEFNDNKKTKTNKKSKFFYGQKVTSSKIFEVRKDVIIDSNNLITTKKDPTFENKKDIKTPVKNALNKLYEETKIQSIRLTPGTNVKDDNDMKKRTHTKIGGVPYWPNDKPFPTVKKSNKSNEEIPMLMLAQLNFNDLPKLEGFPSSGIMQFFVRDDDADTTGFDNITVVYHLNIVSVDKMLQQVPRSTVNDDPKYYKLPDDAKYFPIKGVYYPTAKIEEHGINPSNNEWSSKLIKYLNEEFNTDWKTWKDIPKEVDKVIWDNIPKDYWGCRIGGHPSFTQGDVRKGVKTEIMLLQLDSEAGMMWGDVGVANFFTSKNALSSKNFTKKVLFTWDCC